MKIIWNFVLIITGLSLFLQLAGIQTGFAGLFSILGITTNSQGVSDFGLTTSIFYTTILGLLTAATVGGAILSFFTRASPENYVIIPIVAAVLVIYIGDIQSIISYAAQYGGWVSAIGVLILAPLGVGFAFGLLDYFRGGDF